MKTKLWKIVECQRGQTLTEFAIALPVLMLVLLAIFQFGITFKNYLDLTDAVRVGGRRAAVMRLDPNREQKTKAAVKAAAPALKLTDADITVSSPTWKTGDDVRVTAKYPYEIDLLGIVVQSGVMTSEVVERVE